MNRTEWTEQVLDSLNNAKRASAPPFLLTRIEARLSTEVSKRVIKPLAICFATLSFAILIAINFSVFEIQQSPKVVRSAQIHLGEYSLTSHSFDLYQ